MNTCRPDYQPFPTAILPAPLDRFVRAASSAIGCDESFAAVPLLAVLAGLIGNSYRLRLKRKWFEPAVVWALIVGESGTFKSPALRLVMEPVERLQMDLLQEHKEALKEYAVQLEEHEKALAGWRKDKSSTDGPPERPQEPVAERIYCGDATMEALVSILEENPRGVLLFRDELSGWARSFDCYRQGRGGDVAHWLAMHGAAPVIVDRKSGAKRILSVERAAVSVLGGIQPGVLRRALAGEHMEDGLAARLVFAMPERRPRRWTDADIDEELGEQYTAVVRSLRALPMTIDPEGHARPTDLDLDRAAKACFVEFVNEHAQAQAKTDGVVAAAFSKLEGYAARFALLVHLVRLVAGLDPPVDPKLVDAASMQAGIEIARWATREAERVFQALAERPEDKGARELIELVREKGGRITARELCHSLRRFRSDAAGARAALDELVQAGFGRWRHPAPGPQGGRPTEVFDVVNPEPDEGGCANTPAGTSAAGGFGSGDIQGLGHQAGAGSYRAGPRNNTPQAAEDVGGDAPSRQSRDPDAAQGDGDVPAPAAAPAGSGSCTPIARLDGGPPVTGTETPAGAAPEAVLARASRRESTKVEPPPPDAAAADRGDVDGAHPYPRHDIGQIRPHCGGDVGRGGQP